MNGKVFGGLTVISEAERGVYPGSGKRYRKWKCLCECGETRVVSGGNLKRGHTTSCGCRMKAKASEMMTKLNTTHGKARSRLYGIWVAMKKRCHNSNHVAYDHYGGRGIKVCQRWIDSFEAFAEDMGEPPSDEHTLNRKENDGDYNADNCNWATEEEQQNNRSNNRFLEYENERLTFAQWTRIKKFGKNTIRERIQRGWSVERALTTPVVKHAA